MPIKGLIVACVYCAYFIFKSKKRYVKTICAMAVTIMLLIIFKETGYINFL